MAFWPLKWSSGAPNWSKIPLRIFWTKFSQFGPSDDHFRGQKAIFETIWGLKTACFAHETALWGLPGGLKGPKMGQSDTYLVNISHSINYVVFGTKFSAIQDF